MGTAFILGAIAFSEVITNLFFGVIAIPTLVLGVFLILSCQQKQISETNDRDEVILFSSILGSESNVENNNTEITGRNGEIQMNILQSTNTIDNPGEDFDENMLNNSSSFLYERVESTFKSNSDMEMSSHSNADRENRSLLKSDNTSMLSITQWRVKYIEWLENENTLHTIKAVFICILAGLCDGSLMVPFKLTMMTSHNDDSKLHDTLCYLASFGISSIVVTPTVYLLYYLFNRFYSTEEIQPPLNSSNNTIITNDETHNNDNNSWIPPSVLPGLSSGILWASANILSVHATWFLGMKVGFPLTQTCVVFNALWGILYFKEIDLMDYKSGNLMRFAGGLVMVMLGSYFLAHSAS